MRRPIERIYTDCLLDVSANAPAVEEKFRLIQDMGSRSPEMRDGITFFLLEQLTEQRRGLQEALANQEAVKALLEKVTEEPWHSAVYAGSIVTSRGERALVAQGNARRVVELGEAIPLESLCVGDEVFLTSNGNLIIERSSLGPPRCGETAALEKVLGDGRVVLKSREEEYVVQSAMSLNADGLRPGDLIRWDRAMQIAFEKVEVTEGRQYFLDDVPEIGVECVGGQDKNLKTLLDALTIILTNPERARRFNLHVKYPCVLMEGPPGVGKTLMARVAASEITRRSGTRCRFSVVKPGEWEDPFVGVTQQKIRATFRALREAGEEGFAVLFLDEIEAMGRHRGSAVGHHSDKFLAALLAEFEGFKGRGNVAIIAATNRKDLLEPALLERFEIEIPVRRPDMRGAKSIFGIHLPASLPYSPNGTAAEDTRREMIETAVSRFYSPNADNDLCTLRFRDGKTRLVTARDLASGRVFEQVCRAACKAAFLRPAEGEEDGLRLEDMQNAVSDAMERLTHTLTVRNVHIYLPDLSTDLDVASVEPVTRKVTRPQRYLRAA